MERIAMDSKSMLSLKQLSFIISRQENQKKWFWYDGKITKSKRVSQKRTSIVKDGEDLNGLEIANLKNKPNVIDAHIIKMPL